MGQRFGDIVGKARRSRRMTLKELSAAVGLGTSVISEIEHGHRLPPGDVGAVERFAKFLGLDAVDLKQQASVERSIGKNSIEKRLLKVNPELACGFAREVEGMGDDELIKMFANVVDSIKREREGKS